MTDVPTEVSRTQRGVKTAVSAAHELVSQVLGPGDVAIDATLGNGHDLIFLARRVGRSGAVFAFDTQPAAHRSARQRIYDSQVEATIRLLKTGHERMGEVLPRAVRGRVKAIMFNLGYLPGGDKSIITRPETTIAALGAGLEWLAPEGVITVVAYPGHDGGPAEVHAVEEWARHLDRGAYAAVELRPLNQVDAPRLIAVQRRGMEDDAGESAASRNEVQPQSA